jgi:hypothetical protein
MLSTKMTRLVFLNHVCHTKLFFTLLWLILLFFLDSLPVLVIIAQVRKEIAPLAAAAAWHLGRWQTLDHYVAGMVGGSNACQWR